MTRGVAFPAQPLGTEEDEGQAPHACPVGVRGRGKQKELEVLMHDQDYDLIGITKAWWAQPHDWNINTEGCSWFWKERQGIKGECVAVCIEAGRARFAVGEELAAVLPQRLHAEGLAGSRRTQSPGHRGAGDCPCPSG